MARWSRTVHGVYEFRGRRNERRTSVVEKRFLTLADVGEVLNISSSQTYALVRSGELPAIQIGGRGYLEFDVAGVW